MLAEVLKKPGYKAGNTLKLILPFLKAYGITDWEMRNFSSKTLVLISNVKESLKFIRGFAHTFIVSTSYEHYVKALCEAINFPYTNTYCTKVKIDKYKLSQKEKERLRKLATEITKMPIIEIPLGAKSVKDLPKQHRQVIKRLDEIFWEEIAEMEIGKIFSEVNPIGGHEKAEAIKHIIKQLGISLADVVYVGDSITDVEAFKLVRQGRGLTISFNGNEYAVREAEVAVMSEKAFVTALLTEVFSKLSKKDAIELASNWNVHTLKKLNLKIEFRNRILEVYGDNLPRVEVVKPENMERLMKESVLFRKSVRGEAIGRLG